MMEKILERLEEEEVKWVEIYRQLHNAGRIDSYADGRSDGATEAIEIVQEVAKEYSKDTNVRSKLHTILDYLQFVRDNADKYDSEDGWELSDLIILATEYQKGE